MSITVIEDVDYTTNVPGVGASEPHQKLDLFLPESPQPVPPVLVIHGGGWYTQHRKGKREQSIATDLAAAGFAAASIDYALVELDNPDKSRGLWPAMVTDCKLATAFLRLNATQYNMNPDRIGAIGGSAGAHLAAMLGVTNGADGFDPAPELDCTVQAVGYLYGVCDVGRWIANAVEHRGGMDAADIMLDTTDENRNEAYAQASPVSYLSKDSAPMFLVHGDADDIIPYTETEYFYERAQAAGVESELILVPDAKHGFDLNPSNMNIKDPAITFFRKHLCYESGSQGSGR